MGQHMKGSVVQVEGEKEQGEDRTRWESVVLTCVVLPPALFVSVPSR